MRPISVTYSQLIRILWDRKAAAVLPIFVAFIVAFCFVKMSTKLYTGWSDVLIDVRTSDPLLGSQSALSSSYLATQLDIIRSERVALAASTLANLRNQPKLIEDWKKTRTPIDQDTWLARWVQTGLRVTPSRDSGVISIGFINKDAAFAAFMANIIARAYVQTTLELRLAPTQLNSSFFEKTAASARTELERTQTALSNFQRSHNMVSIKDSLDIESTRLGELSSALVNVEATSSDNQSRTSVAAQRGPDSMQEVLNSSTIQNLKTDVDRLQRSLLELQTRLGAQHPQVKSELAALNEARSRLTAETNRVVTSIATSGSAIRQRELQARTALEAQKLKILQLRGLRDQADVLSRDVDTAQRQFDRANDRSNQATLESQYMLTNVSVLTLASQPDRPSAPQTLLITVVLLVVGAIVGLVLAIGLELSNRKVRSPQDLVEVLQIPVLTVFGDYRLNTYQSLLSFEVPFVRIR